MTTTPGLGEETASQVPDAPVPAPPGPSPDRDDVRTWGCEPRLEHIVSTIQEFAALRFDARAQISPDGDIVDAVAAGVNFLGEELEASFSEIERQVADRTAELASATRELGRRVLHDELTGLPNRTLFWDRLSQRLSLVDRRQTGFAVLFLDLDDFKEVNDTLGHAAGDRLLVDVASRIRATLRTGDTAARVGGDEFVVLLDDVATKEAALVIANRLSEALRAPYKIGTDWRIATASIGVAVGPESLGPATAVVTAADAVVTAADAVVTAADAVVAAADAVVAAADAAMYDAKRRGPGRCVLYSQDRHGQAELLPVGDDGRVRPGESIREVLPA